MACHENITLVWKGLMLLLVRENEWVVGKSLSL
jgi:hypothetical protein